MSKTIAKEMLPRLRQRYTIRGMEGKRRLITEVCEQWEYSRKHAIKLLNAKAGWGGDPNKKKGTTVSLWRGGGKSIMESLESISATMR